MGLIINRTSLTSGLAILLYRGFANVMGMGSRSIQLYSIWYDRELRTYEEQQQMPYITSVEQIGYDRGQVEGKVEERKSIALKCLEIISL